MQALPDFWVWTSGLCIIFLLVGSFRCASLLLSLFALVMACQVRARPLDNFGAHDAFGRRPSIRR